MVLILVYLLVLIMKVLRFSNGLQKMSKREIDRSKGAKYHFICNVELERSDLFLRAFLGIVVSHSVRHVHRERYVRAFPLPFMILVALG